MTETLGPFALDLRNARVRPMTGGLYEVVDATHGYVYAAGFRTQTEAENWIKEHE